MSTNKAKSPSTRWPRKPRSFKATDMLRDVVTTCRPGNEDSWSPMDIFLPWDKQQRMATKQELEARTSR